MLLLEFFRHHIIKVLEFQSKHVRASEFIYKFQSRKLEAVIQFSSGCRPSMCILTEKENLFITIESKFFGEFY